MIYDITNLKVGDYVRVDTDAGFRLPFAIIPNRTIARVCTMSMFSGDFIGLEFQISCSFKGGHDCFGAGRPGYCAWVSITDVQTCFSTVELVTKLDIDMHYGSPERLVYHHKLADKALCHCFVKSEANPMSIDKVIFNDPATIVFWKDGSKTVVKAENEPFDKEKGLAMAISKKALGNKGNYYDTFKEHIPDSRIVYHHKLTDDERLIPVPKDIKIVFEDNDIRYIELPNGPRLKYRDGEWYVEWDLAE